MPRDVVELRTLADRQPELAPAANLRVDLIESVRRAKLTGDQSRIAAE